MDYSVVLFDLKTEGAPSEKPLMLQPVLFCPVLAWVCQEASGLRHSAVLLSVTRTRGRKCLPPRRASI